MAYGGIIGCLYSPQLDEVQVEYTNCNSIDPAVWSGSCEDYLERLANLSNIERVGYPECQCQVSTYSAMNIPVIERKLETVRL